VNGACDLAALLHLRRVSYVDDDGVAPLDQLLRLRRADARHDGIGGFH